jgi:multiple sugar transport system ATP-binding protein
VVRADGLARQRVGETVPLGLPPEACHLFDGDGRALHNGSLLSMSGPAAC